MKSIIRRSALSMLTLACLGTLPAIAADPGKLTIHVNQPGAAINPMLYGLMTEEINYSYDGGLYAELIQNRIFQNTTAAAGARGGRGNLPASTTAAPPTAPAAPIGSLAHWTAAGNATIALDATNPVNTVALKTSARIDITQPGGGISNDGFWGIPIKPNTSYKASFYARGGNNFSGPLTVSIVDNDGKVSATAKTEPIDGQWKQYKLTLTTAATAPTLGKFVISGDTPGSVWLNLVSLFPPTFKDRPNGFRTDLMQLLDDMHPAFLRFPGGNYVEGNSWADRYDWKKTIGAYENRPGHNSPWRYRSSDGMGLLEFLYWCEDLKMEPVLAVFAGHILGNGNTTVTGAELQPYVEEALEEIEYVTGDATTTKWGAQRARDGHPAPFKLTYVEIGNEDNLSNGQANYEERFAAFHNAIKAKYPNLQTISTVPTTVRNYNRTTKPDVIDDHYYMNFNQSLNNAHLYDKKPRDGAKIFVGEWATRDNLPTPSFRSALGDAAFLTGLERNADLVIMSCYAPLFVNVNPGGQQWATDLIGYNAMSSFGSPSYYVQRMFYNSRGDVVLPVAELVPQAQPATLPAPPGRNGNGAPAAPVQQPEVLFASASRENATGDIILKVVNPRELPQALAITFDGAPTIAKEAKGEILTGNDLAAVNTLSNPMNIAPKALTITDAAAKFTHEFPPNSVSVIRFKTK